MVRFSPFLVSMAVAVVLLAVLSACNQGDEPEPTSVPTIEPTQLVQEASSTPTRSGPTHTPSPTFPPTVTPAPPSPTLAPMPTDAPTDTPEPYTFVIKEGNTCSELAVVYDVSVDSIRELNPGLNCGNLQINQTVLIPRPTPTPTPAGFDATQTAIVAALPTRLRNATPYNIYEYCAVKDDTLVSIALKNGTTSKRICELNSGPGGLDCRGCDFSTDIMGDCAPPPLIGESQCYRVPGPTYTPTYTPTFSGQETATPTPTHLPPRAILPADGAMVTGSVQLNWVAFGELQENEYFQVTVIDELGGGQIYQVTRNTNYSLPDEWRPAAGQTRQIIWSVDIVVRGENALFIPVSGPAATRRFTWQGQ